MPTEETHVIHLRDELTKALRAGPPVLRAIVRDLPDDAVRRRPAEGEWAIVEVTAHLADTEERTLDRIRRMLDEDGPTLAPYDPHALSVERGYLRMDVAAEAERYARLRRETLEVLASLSDADWTRVGHHGEHGTITVEDLVAHTVGEDADHYAQISRLVPGIA
jgi:uncharacterized damage-inducible protein DinB